MQGMDYYSPTKELINMVDFILQNWAALLLGLMALAKIVVNLTPTEKDNKIFGYLDILIDAVISDRKRK